MQKLSNNTTLCLAKRIGYTQNNFLCYQQNWPYCIDFYFDFEKMHPSDLFLILFSYIRNREVQCLFVYTISKNLNKIKIFSKKQNFEFYKMTYREFENGGEDRRLYDSFLLDAPEDYGFRLEFVPELVDYFVKRNETTLENFCLSYKPTYPGSEELTLFFDYYFDSSNEAVMWEKSYLSPTWEKPIKG